MSWRLAISVLGGVVTAGLVMLVIEGVGMAIFPLPDDIDPMDPAQLTAAMDAGRVPLGALVSVVIAWCAAAFSGGLLAAYLGQTQPARLGLATGAVLLALSVLNLAQIPHPVWMAVLGVVVWLPLAYAGARMAAHLPADPRDTPS